MHTDTTDTSIRYLEAAAGALLDLHPERPATQDREDALADGVLDLLRWIHSGGTFADAQEATAALRHRASLHLAATDARTSQAPGSATCGEHLWVPAGPDPLEHALVRERLDRTLQAMTRLPAPQRNAIISDMVGEPAAAFEDRTGWSSRRRKRTAARGRDTLRTATIAVA